MAPHPDEPDPEEARLWDQVRHHPGLPPDQTITAETLRQIAAAEGLDFATALLYQTMRQRAPHAAFADGIDRLRREPVRPVPAGNTLIGIVPAAFYRQMPHTGADGRVIARAAASLGLPSALIPIKSTGTLAENAAIIRDWLKSHPQRRILLCSLCKGGADIKYALGQPGAGPDFSPVSAWVNICGSVHGSPFAQWLLTTKPRFIAAWVYFKCQRHDFRMLRELVPAPAGPLAPALALPPGLTLVNIAGFPLRRHLSNGFMRRCHGFISDYGPNDGGILLADVCRLPGTLYPVWGADHYLRPETRAGEILTAILRRLLAGTPAAP